MLIAGSGNLVSASSTGSTNSISSSGSIISISGTSGTNVVAGSGNIFVSKAAGSNAVINSTGLFFGQSEAGCSIVSKVPSGDAFSFLAGFANSTMPGLYQAGNGGFVFGAGFTNSISNTFSVGFGSQMFNVRSNGVGISTNLPQAELHVVGNGIITSNLDVGQFVNAAHGSFAMSTGVVTVATSASTNLFTNAWNYAFTDAPVGTETNTSLVVSNACHVFVSFGAAMSSDVGGVGTMSCHFMTNGVPCSVIRIEAAAAGATTYETGFKEIAISLPANCRVGLAFGQTAAQSVNVKNVVLNIKGAN